MKGFRVENIKDYLLMHGMVLIFGLTGIMGKLIQLDFYQIVFHRMWIGGLSLLLFLWVSKTRFSLPSFKQFMQMVGVGIMVLLHWLTFFKAIQVSTVSVGVLCLATTAFHVSWLEPLVMKRKFSKLELVLGLLIILGVVKITGFVGADQTEGMIWGLISALFAAFFSVFNAYLNRHEKLPSSIITLYEMLSGSALLLLVLGLSGRVDAAFFEMGMSDFGWLLFLGIICTSLAFMLMIEVIDKIGAYTVSLTINLEPIYSILLAIPILSENEILTSSFYVGAFFILLIVFANPWLKRLAYRRERKKRLRKLRWERQYLR